MVPVKPHVAKLWIIFNEIDPPMLNWEVGTLKSYNFTLTNRKQIKKRETWNKAKCFMISFPIRQEGGGVSPSFLSCFPWIASARSWSRSLEVHIDIGLLFGTPHLLTHEGIYISEFTGKGLALLPFGRTFVSSVYSPDLNPQFYKEKEVYRKSLVIFLVFFSFNLLC